MRWSYRILKVNEISIELHLTFILFFLFILLFVGLHAFLFFTLIFTVVLAHELIHSFTAILHGIHVPRIMLLPIGGLAHIELPDEPLLELKVSVVGPLFNFMLAGVGLLILGFLDSSFIGYDSVLSGVFSESFGMNDIVSIISVLVSMNIILGAFNMLPAFPMDGGRVFRSVLALWVDYVTATRIASMVGQFIFLSLAFLGVLTLNLWWVFIGLFLSYAGGSEMKYVNLKKLMGDVKLKDIACSDLGYVNASLTWRDFMSTVYRRGRKIYLIIAGEGVVKGILDLAEIENLRHDASVGETRGIEYVVLDGAQRAADTLKILLAKKIVLVTEGGKLVGYVTAETLADSAEYFTLTKRLT